MTLFRNGGAFFVDVRTEKKFSNGRFPVARLFPSTNWNVRAGWTAVFPASRSSFFAAREAGRRIRPSSWKEAPRARHISLGAGFSPGNRRDFRFGAYASCCPVLRRNRLLSPGFLPDSCILSEPCLFRPPFSIGTGAFLCLSSVEIAKKGWQRLTENRKCSQMSAGAESAARFMLLLFRRLSW